MTFKMYYNGFEVIIVGNKALKNRTPIGSAADTDLLNKLKDYSKESGIPVSRLLDKAIALLLKPTK